jgi:phosphocarrier protein HPr
MVAQTNSRTVCVTDQHGLHLRPCSVIVRTVSRYRAMVTVYKGSQAVDAGSMFELLSLAATHGTELVLSASGPDAWEALEAVAGLFAGEPELAHCA